MSEESLLHVHPLMTRGLFQLTHCADHVAEATPNFSTLSSPSSDNLSKSNIYYPFEILPLEEPIVSLIRKEGTHTYEMYGLYA